MVDRLMAEEMAYKELQLRMADPEVASDATEFQKVAKKAADIEEVVNTYRWGWGLQWILGEACGRVYCARLGEGCTVHAWVRRYVQYAHDQLSHMHGKHGL